MIIRVQLWLASSNMAIGTVVNAYHAQIIRLDRFPFRFDCPADIHPEDGYSHKDLK